MTPNDALLIMWLTFTGMAVLGVSAVLVWAVRSRQFADQDRARYLPLTSGIPAEEPKAGGAGAQVKLPAPSLPASAGRGASGAPSATESETPPKPHPASPLGLRRGRRSPFTPAASRGALWRRRGDGHVPA